MSAKVIDGFVVTPIESLKAEWLYSQGRGRQFRLGEQEPLARYLSSICPLSGEVLENENERKLRLILSKAQQHQRQLQEEISGKRLGIIFFWRLHGNCVFFFQKMSILRVVIRHRRAGVKDNQVEYSRPGVSLFVFFFFYFMFLDVI